MKGVPGMKKLYENPICRIERLSDDVLTLVSGGGDAKDIEDLNAAKLFI